MRVVSHSLYVSQPIDDQHQSLAIVSHASQEKDHLRHKIAVFANAVSFLEVIRVAGA